jgi:hypothetical protein
MVISNPQDIELIFIGLFSNSVMVDPSRQAPPLRMPLSESFDAGNGVFAASRASARLREDSSLSFNAVGENTSLSFANSYLISLHGTPILSGG